MSKQWQPDTLVWARLEPFPDWPARVIDTREAPKSVLAEGEEGDILVLFFGSNDFGWVAPENVSDFKEKFDKNRSKSKDSDFLRAVSEAEKWRPEQKLPLRQIFRDLDTTPVADRKPTETGATGKGEKKTTNATPIEDYLETLSSGSEGGNDDENIRASAPAAVQSRKQKSSPGDKPSRQNKGNSLLIPSGDDDIENSEDVSSVRSNMSRKRKDRPSATVASGVERDLFDNSDTDELSTRSKRQKTAASQPKGKTKRGSSDAPSADLSTASSSNTKKNNASKGQQSKLEFVAVGELSKLGLKSSTSSGTAGTKKAINTSSSTPITANPSPLPPTAAPSAVEEESANTDALALAPTQAWAEPADNATPLITPPSQSILELTPARATRSTRSAAAAAASAKKPAPLPQTISSSNISAIFAVSPVKRTPRVAGKRNQGKSQSQDVGSLDIMPTQPFAEEVGFDGPNNVNLTLGGDAHPEKTQPYVPPSQMMPGGEPTPIARRTRHGNPSNLVPPSPIMITETPARPGAAEGPGMLSARRRSSRLSQNQIDADATISDPRKLDLNPVSGAKEAALSQNLIDFDVATIANTAPLTGLPPLSTNNFIGFNLGKQAPTSPSSKRLSGVMPSTGGPPQRRARLQQHEESDSSPNQAIGISKDELAVLLREEREHTLQAVREMMEQTAGRIEVALSNKIETSLKAHTSTNENQIEGLKKFLLNAVKLEIRTAIADSRPVNSEESSTLRQQQHIQAVVESLNGMEKMISAFRDSLSQPPTTQGRK